MTDTDALWAAVDAITKPTRRQLLRTPEHDTTPPPWIRRVAGTGSALVCDVTIYRATYRRHVMATRRYAVIPSLWEQAVTALQTGTEQTEGGGMTPLRERSPADLELMETMLAIRETVGDFHRRPGVRITSTEALPKELRALASAVIRHQPDDVDDWTARIDQWARILGRHLQAIDTGPKPVRLRNSPCPECGARSVVLQTVEGPKVFPPILIDFKDGLVRAATCSKCRHVWWRGDDLEALADRLGTGPDTPSGPPELAEPRQA